MVGWLIRKENQPPENKDTDLLEDDLYADLEEQVPDEEIEEDIWEPGEEQEMDEDEEMDDDDEDTRFFIDEGNWEVRSEEAGSDGELLEDDKILETDEDEPFINEIDDDYKGGAEENKDDTRS